MEQSNISLFSQDIEIPQIANNTFSWLNTIASSYDYEIDSANYIFCSDDYLLEVNREYLNHDYYTDIITFDNSDEEGIIESDIFISIDRIKDNAQKHEVSFENELLRVMAHGLLHLCGFKDKTEEEATEMRNAENKALSLWTK